MSDLTDSIQRGWATADPDAPEPTVSYFHDLLGQHPADPHALFAYASALDFASREAEAAPAYEQAFAADYHQCLWYMCFPTCLDKGCQQAGDVFSRFQCANKQEVRTLQRELSTDFRVRHCRPAGKYMGRRLRDYAYSFRLNVQVLPYTGRRMV